ncbi:MAG: hypothetical protein H6765_09700 [Candidatus Peribacteria bacterium]|nr:MAG: hypothetical protein H6765_09700 [Candidatus Peribacteria bacterium]
MKPFTRFGVRNAFPELPQPIAWLIDAIPILGVRKANKILYRISSLEGAAFLKAFQSQVGVSIQVVNQELIPVTGRTIVPFNHPGGLDVLAILSAVLEVRKDARFLTNSLLNLQNIARFLILVHTTARVKMSPEGKEEMLQLFAEEGLLIQAAAGRNSFRNTVGVIEDTRWTKNLVLWALEYELTIVPTHVTGRNSNRYYELREWRERMVASGNKLLKNIRLEQYLMLSELVNPVEKHIVVTFGRPVSSDQVRSCLKKVNNSPEALAEAFRIFVHQLGSGGSHDFYDWFLAKY